MIATRSSRRRPPLSQTVEPDNAAGRAFADRLSALLALLSGEGPEANRAACAAAAEAPPASTLETCPARLLTPAFGEAAEASADTAGLSAAERLALVLVRAGGLSEQRAAEIAGLPADELERCLASAEAALARAPARRAVVLEDHFVTREMLVDYCAASGLEVVAATERGPVAVAAAAAFAPAIAVVDIDLDGAELAGDLAAMQIREVAPDCHVLFVTGYPQAERMAEVMENATALIKPFRAAEFSSAVRAAL